MSEFTARRIHIIIIALGAMIWIVALCAVAGVVYLLLRGG